MTLTVHAQRRSQQRAVSLDMLELAMAYGRELASYGDQVFLFDDRSLRRAPREVQRLSDRLRGLCVILAADKSVRTVMWRRSIRHRPGVLRRQRLLEAA